MGVAGVNLLRILLTVCCLQLLVPGGRADWETVHCETAADSIPVATAQSAIDNFSNQHWTITKCCINPWDKPTGCESFQSVQEGTANYNLGACGAALHCDNCYWVASMWTEVVNQCAINYDGVDRVAGFVSYDWSPGIWMHYRIWKP